VDEVSPQFSHMKEFTDSDGVTWRRRGEPIDGKALARRVRKEEFLVRHNYLGDIVEIEPDQREEFWASAERLMADSPHSDFIGAEFKDPTGRHLIVIDEHC